MTGVINSAASGESSDSLPNVSQTTGNVKSIAETDMASELYAYFTALDTSLQSAPRRANL